MRIRKEDIKEETQVSPIIFLNEAFFSRKQMNTILKNSDVNALVH